jgi:hypothetical protein
MRNEGFVGFHLAGLDALNPLLVLLAVMSPFKVCSAVNASTKFEGSRWANAERLPSTYPSCMRNETSILSIPSRTSIRNRRSKSMSSAA